MGKRFKIKFVVRGLMLLLGTILSIARHDNLNNFMTFNILGPIRICDIFWGFLLYEMLQVLIPKLNKYTYSGKSFKRHYHSDNSYDKTKLLEYTKKNTKKAINAFIYWTLTNIVMITIYYKLNLNRDYLFMLFLFYYWMDVFCINIWCPFQKIFVRNKCCNECRIYNWGPLMYLIPLMFIPSFWTYSLCIVGIILFVQWEYLNFKHPERFSPVSNKILRCENCKNNCRFNKYKKKNSNL